MEMQSKGKKKHASLKKQLLIMLCFLLVIQGGLAMAGDWLGSVSRVSAEELGAHSMKTLNVNKTKFTSGESVEFTIELDAKASTQSKLELEIWHLNEKVAEGSYPTQTSYGTLKVNWTSPITGNNREYTAKAYLAESPKSYVTATFEVAGDTAHQVEVLDGKWSMPLDDLAPDSNGRVSIEWADGADQLLLPLGASEIKGAKAFVIRGSGVTVQIPASVLRQVADLLPAEKAKGAHIAFIAKKLDSKERDSLANKLNVPEDSKASLASEIYDFALKAIDTDGNAKTSEAFAAPIELSFPLGSDANPELAGIYNLTNFGDFEYVGGEWNNGSMIAAVTHFSLYAAMQYSQAFTDVPGNYWAANAIKTVSAKHIMNGIDYGQFAPDGLVTRAQFTAMLVRYLGLSANGKKANFSDVAEQDWFADVVEAAFESGIVTGTSANTFDPNRTITSEEIIAMVVRAYEYKFGPYYTDVKAVYTDVAQISDWAKVFIDKASALGLLQGIGREQIAPKQAKSRAESAQIMYNLISNQPRTYDPIYKAEGGELSKGVWIGDSGQGSGGQGSGGQGSSGEGSGGQGSGNQYSEYYEAEDGALGQGVWIGDTIQASGGRFVGGIDSTNDMSRYVELTVNVPAAGPYNVYLSYANGGGDAKLILLVNGQNYGVDILTPHTGDWSMFGRGSADFTVNLQQGSNKLKFANKEQYTQIDYIKLSAPGAKNKTVRVAGGYEIDMSDLPKVHFGEHPEWAELFDKAWDTHKGNIRKARSALNPTPNSYYVDEAYNDYIYAWDTMFMTMFNKYGLNQFPTLSSLDNFYYHQVDSAGPDDGFIDREVSEVTGEFAAWNAAYDDPKSLNPPLWAWAEWEQYLVHGDVDRFTKVINGKTIFERLISHFNFVERTRTMSNGLYGKTTGLANGLDNTPNQDHGDLTQTYNDLSIQQAQAAYYISLISKELGDTNKELAFKAKYEELKQKINDLLWSEDGKFYFNLDQNGNFTNIATPTGLWAMAANVATPDRADSMIRNYALNSEKMFRPNGLSTVTYDYANPNNPNSKFWPMGNYWEGAVWAPTSYQYMKGLHNYGYNELAFQEGIRHLNMLTDVYEAGKTDDKIGQATFWENYSSEYTLMGQRQFDHEYARSHFVGWTGDLVIGSMIEDVIGVRLNAPANKVNWNINLVEEHGISNLYMKHQGVANRISLSAAKRKSAASSVQITVTASHDFTLNVTSNGVEKTFQVEAGTHDYIIAGQDEEEAYLAAGAHKFDSAHSDLSKAQLDANAADYVVFTSQTNAQIKDGIQNRLQKGNLIYNINTIGYRANSSENPMSLADNQEATALGFNNAKSIVKAGYSEGEEGFMLMVPADNALKTLKVLVGVKNAKVTIKSSLSDGSRKRQSQVLYGNDTEQTYLVEIPYRASADGNYLQVENVIEHGNLNGTISLKGIFLYEGGSEIPQQMDKVTVSSSDRQLVIGAQPMDSIDSYRIYYGTDRAELNQVVEANNLPYTITNLVNYKKYYVAVAGVKAGTEGTRSDVVSGIPEERPMSDSERATKDIEAAWDVVLNGNQSFDAITGNLNFAVQGNLYGSNLIVESTNSGNVYGVMSDGTVKNPIQPHLNVEGTLKISSTYNGTTVQMSKNITVVALSPQEVASVSGSVVDFTGNTLDLTAEGTKDWTQYYSGDENVFARKQGANFITGFKRLSAGDGNATDSPISFSATDAGGHAPANQNVITHRASGQVGFEFNLPTSEQVQQVHVYPLAYDSVVQLDFLVNGRVLYSDQISQVNGSKIGKFTIDYKALNLTDQIKVRLRMVTDYHTNSWGGSAGLAAVTLQEEAKPTPYVAGTVADFTGNTLNLTAEGTKDWTQYFSGDENVFARKQGANSIAGFKRLGAGDGNATDSPISFNATDADGAAPEDQHVITYRGSESAGFEFDLPTSEEVQQVHVYPLAYDSVMKLEFLINGRVLYSDQLSQVNGSTIGKFTIKYKALNLADQIKVRLSMVTDHHTNSWGGSIGLAAVTLQETN
ncbi:hypothetical protein BJP48_09315 [Paenibacillus odorifer]|nr:hypothetical protein BJP47_25005 [Paenibacillus odorifer]OMD21036.1 hypothetical protein BJP48_09315 [Paenibacillus odorifer]